MKVRTYDYMLPIIFTYKGWSIIISESSSFFKFADIKVDITISIDPSPYYSMLVQAYEEQEQMRMRMRRTSFAPNRCKISSAQENKIIKIINDFVKTQNKISYSQSVNGGMLDRFMGQNISAVKKVHQNTIDYIDSNLGIADVRDEFINYLKMNNI